MTHCKARIALFCLVLGIAILVCCNKDSGDLTEHLTVVSEGTTRISLARDATG